jgi:FMN reductase [NAD(P)H]
VIRNAGLLQRINAQTHEAMLNSDMEFLRQRASLPGYRPLYGAPALLLLSGPADGRYSAVNAALSAENMILEATGSGLGSCFIVTPALVLNRPENSALAREAGIPEGHVLQCAVIVGYAAAEDPYTLTERAKKGVVSYID